ncbi:MAG: carbohydrate kinase family protein [Parcubacteria group bacterium]|jgi:ribokinase
MSRVICIGSACKDVFFPTTEGKIIETPEDLLSQQKIEFELGAKYRIEERFEALGGCAANVAVGLSRLGIDAACYSHIGNDHVADWILDQLKKNKVSVDLITKDKELFSDMSAIVVDRNSAEHVIFSNQKVSGKLELVPEKISSAEWIFIGDLHGDWRSQLDLISRIAKEHKLKLAYNPKQIHIHDDVKKIIEIITETEVLFLNKDEALEVISQIKNFSTSDLDNEFFLLQELKEMGANIVVITDGVRGAWATNGTDVLYAPGRMVKALDSTGAGDSFASGFLGAHIKGKILKVCLDWGIVNSSHEVRFYGSIKGLLDEKEMLENGG